MNTFPGADERVAHLDIAPTLAVTPWLDRWVRFEPHGRVRVFTGKVELGQGILSAIAQIAAEELDVAYECIDVEAVDTDFSPNEGSTSGSRSIQEGGESMRQACATPSPRVITPRSTRSSRTTRPSCGYKWMMRPVCVQPRHGSKLPASRLTQKTHCT